MRKIKFLPFLIIFTVLFPSCKTQEKRIDLFMSTQENKVIDLTLDELSAKLLSNKETFFLATHKEESCECWTKFKSTMFDYNNKRKESGKEFIPFYAFDTTLLGSSPLIEQIQEVMSGYTDLYVIQNGETLTRYTKSAKKDFLMFENVNEFSQIIESHIKNDPNKNIKLIDLDYMENSIMSSNDSSIEKAVVIIIRSGCPDCSYMLPNVLYPFVKDNNLKLPIFILDIEKYYSNKTNYNEIKEKLKLTDLDLYGYLSGVVPTYQYWENNTLKDAGVYANDTLKYNGNSIVLDQTYFDGSRLHSYTNANLLSEVNNLSDNDVYKYGEDVYWKIESAAIYHNKILLDFLLHYTIGE